jgi:hypothetical protein
LTNGEGRCVNFAGPGTRPKIRYLVGGLAIERWRLRAGQLGAVLGKRPEVITRWAAHAGARRQTDEAFHRRYEELDEVLCHARRNRRKRISS